MIISNSVIIQQRSDSAICSASGFFLPGTNYVITSATWLSQFPLVSKKFEVLLELADHRTVKRSAILLEIVPVWKLGASLRKLQHDVSFSEAVDQDAVSKLSSIVLLEVTGSPLQCR